MQNPAAALVEPVGEELYPEGVDIFLHVADLISLSHWAFVALKKMSGYDVPGTVGEFLAGDWEGVMKSVDALNNLGDFCDRASTGLGEDLTKLEAQWSGKAATAASRYFHDLAGQLSVQAVNFRDIASQYRSTAFGVKEMASSIASCVELLADLAIAAGISLAAAAASSWTVIGPIISGGAATYSIVRGVKVAAEIIELRGKVWTACEALMGLIAGTLGSVHGFTSVSLPAAYDNTRVS